MRVISTAVRLVMGLALVIGSLAGAQATRAVPSQYPTIQAAIDAAGFGDTVLVDHGVYYERIDFKGKAIAVRSVHGPEATVLDGAQLGRVVTFANNETRASVLEGFTVRHGLGGIMCSLASPTIRRNHIVRNTLQRGDGVGISSTGSPLLDRNVIADNTTADWRNRGAGIYSVGNPVLTGNLIFQNRVGQGTGPAIYSGGGSMTVTNCSIVGHRAGNSVRIDGSQATAVFTNTLFWDNTASFHVHVSGSQASATFDYCLVQGGIARVRNDAPSTVQWGAGNIDADPRGVGVPQGDYHLLPGSPCIDAGTANAPMLAATDFDGNPRVAGAGVDIGADEFFPHLYAAVQSAGPYVPSTVGAGAAVDMRIVGPAGLPVLFARSLRTRTPPLTFPNVQGALHLDPGALQATSLGKIPSSGLVRVPLALPRTDDTVIHAQALIGTRLSAKTALPVEARTPGPTLRVPQTFQTIQAAIDSLPDGGAGTILVAPGVYTTGGASSRRLIRLRSTGGAAVTTLSTGDNTAVALMGPPWSRAEVTGFTIINGRAPAILAVSPIVIRDNRILGGGNSPGDGMRIHAGIPGTIVIERNHVEQRQVGIWVFGSRGGLIIDRNHVVDNVRGLVVYDGQAPARITDNVIARNGPLSWNSANEIRHFGPVLVANNVFADNRGLHGGGLSIYASGGLFVHNTVVRNVATSLGGGVVSLGAPPVVANCIIRGNQAPVGPEVSGVQPIYSNVGGGVPGVGNFDADPRFVDPANDDFHLLATSPCIGAAATLPPSVALPHDFESDPRVHRGAPDVGADEFHPHLYLAGVPQRGAPLRIRIIGQPGNQVVWAAASGELVPPVAIPGLTGLLHLDPGTLRPAPLGPIPASGLLSFALPIPAQFPASTTPTQALIGTHLSNLVRVIVP